MVTRTNPTRKRDLACVRIGYHEYLLDADKAMQVIKLFRESVKCERTYTGEARYRYVVGDKPELELMLVEPDQVVMTGGLLAIESKR